MASKITAYACDSCSMTSRSKSSVARHERRSCRNSESRVACSLCKNLEFLVYADQFREYPQGWECNTVSDEEFKASGINENRQCIYFKSKIAGDS